MAITDQINSLKMPKYAKNGDLMHSDDCRMSFGRKDMLCPRCIDLASGSSPRARFGGRHTFAQADAQRCREIAAHNCKAGRCGVVCTFGDW